MNLTDLDLGVVANPILVPVSFWLLIGAQVANLVYHLI